MCVRKRPSNAKLTQRNFAPHTVNNMEVNLAGPAGAAPAGGIQFSITNPRVQRERGNNIDVKPLLPSAFGSGEFMRKRKDDDTLREVGNVMPEYDCDKDDPPKISVEKTQDTIEAPGPA